METGKFYKEYNLLTKKLLAAGYTEENYPDYVEINMPCGKEKTLDNYNGGFSFRQDWIEKQTFQTPCGLLCKGLLCNGNMGYMGIDWTAENDMATINCPYNKEDCRQRHEYLQQAPSLWRMCEVHMTDREYRYEGSAEQIIKLREEEMWRKKDLFIEQRNGRVCQMHMEFNRITQEWEMKYDPYECGLNRCRGRCPLLGRDLDEKRGNVFYDVKLTYRRYDLDGTLFEGQVDTSIQKGRKLFEHPASMDICKICAACCIEKIHWKVKEQYYRKLFEADYYGKLFSYEILNIRAEQRESRDIYQDLEDMKEGIQVIHASDAAKQEKEYKRERRRQQHEAAVKRLEKRLLAEGYWNLETYSLDRRHADKWLGKERIAELEKMRRQQELEKQRQPVQMDLFEAGLLREEG